MPYVKTEKFNVSGENLGDTTFTGDVELELHYDAKEDYFFFRVPEQRKKGAPLLSEKVVDAFVPKVFNRWDGPCRTRSQAVALAERILGAKTSTARVIAFKIGVSGTVLEKIRKSGKKHLSKAFGDHSRGISPYKNSVESGVSVEVAYFIKKTSVLGHVTFDACDRHGRPLNDNSGIKLEHYVERAYEVLPFSEKLADFFEGSVASLESVGLRISEFLNANSDDAASLSSVLEKCGPNILGAGSQGRK